MKRVGFVWLILLATPAFAQPSAPSSAAAARTYDGRSGSLDVEPPRHRSVDRDRRQARRSGVVAGGRALRVLALRAGRRRARGRRHRGARLVFADGDAFRHSRVRAAPATVRATLADRDRIQSDDHVIIFLSTFNDGRQAMVFGVNPLGVQLDGAIAEGTRGTGRRLRRPRQPAAKRPISVPTSSSSRRAASPIPATRSKSAFRSRACAISRSRSRTGAST